LSIKKKTRLTFSALGFHGENKFWMLISFFSKKLSSTCEKERTSDFFLSKIYCTRCLRHVNCVKGMILYFLNLCLHLWLTSWPSDISDWSACPPPHFHKRNRLTLLNFLNVRTDIKIQMLFDLRTYKAPH